jgi:hypothetical protein
MVVVSGRSIENIMDIMAICYYYFSSLLRFPTSLKVRDFFFPCFPYVLEHPS